MTRSPSAVFSPQQQLQMTVDVIEDPMMLMTTEGSSKIF